MRTSMILLAAALLLTPMVAAEPDAPIPTCNHVHILVDGEIVRINHHCQGEWVEFIKDQVGTTSQ